MATTLTAFSRQLALVAAVLGDVVVARVVRALGLVNGADVLFGFGLSGLALVAILLALE